MVQEIIFHLGDRKTGSTSIQDALARGDISSPGKTLFYSSPTNHIPLAKSLHTNDHLPLQEQRFNKLARQLKKSDADIAVISAEHFESVDPALLLTAIEQYLPEYRNNIRLIAYVRPHADRLLSNYAEQIKLGQFAGTLERFYQQRQRKNPLIYTARFDAWRDLFGDRFTLRPFIRSQLVNNDVVHDFADYIFQGATFSVRDAQQSNQSLTLEQLALLREFHLVLGKNKTLQNLQVGIGKQMGRLLADIPQKKRTKLRLHSELTEQIIIASLADAQALDASYFAPDKPMETTLLAARAKAITEPQSIKAGKCLSLRDIRMTRFWANLVVTLAGQTPDTLLSNLQDHLVSELQNPVQTKDSPSKKPTTANDILDLI